MPARPTAGDYAVSAKWQGVELAASLIPARQVEHLFAFDISRSFVVFEVACFADSSAQMKISRDAFVVKSFTAKSKSDLDVVRPSAPETVASAIERQNQPSLPDSRGLGIDTAATIGVARGTDPNTGRPATGVYGGGQVTAENGRRDTAPPNPKPGGTPEDRVMLAAQLRARSIPEGPVNHAVAGYIYFRKSDLKADPDGNYQLEYLFGDDAGATHPVSLLVPAKPHRARSDNN